MCGDDHDHGHTHPVGAGHPTVVPAERGAYTGEVIPLEPVESVSITVLVDNAVDLLLPDQGPAQRLLGRQLPAVPDAMALEGHTLDVPVAEHGFSALLEVVTASGAVHRFLFDTGVSPDGMVENMARLDLAPDAVEVVVCSHGHFDHTMGLDGFVRRVGRANVPIVLHPEFWSQRRIAIPGREARPLPSPSRRSLEDAGFEIVERVQPSFLFERSVLVTGEVARTTEFETGFPVHQAWHDGAWRPDPLILDDQAVVLHVRDRGLVVITGCGHAGVVNITRYARHLTGVDRVHAVIGGFHLGGPLFEPVIPATVAALTDLAPDVVVPAHCTGWRAQQSLASAMPDAFVPNSVGTRFELVAA